MVAPLGFEVLQRLHAHPSLEKTLTFPQIQRFVALCQKIWQEITVGHIASESSKLPPLLPRHACNFLAAVLDLDYNSTQLCWIAFGDFVQEIGLQETDDNMFRIHGLDHRIGAETIHPPIVRCPRPSCGEKLLGEESRVEARLYTLRRGVLPISSVSTYCRNCFTRYYHNYSVCHAADEDAKREYYDGVPKFIHVAEQSFVERDLCVFFEAEMAFAHASAESIARVYNLAIGSNTSTPSSSRLSQDLHDDVVLDSFFLHALLRDKSIRHDTLSLPHHGLQRLRFSKALDERNYLMAGTGQEMWPHACNRCMKLYVGEDGNTYHINAGVTDGVTVGHTCCSVHDCTISLLSPRDRFCPDHAQKRLECCIHGCTSQAEAGHVTCRVVSHRAFQETRTEESTAMFQLRRRLQRAGVAQVGLAGSNATTVDSDDDHNDPHSHDPEIPVPTLVKGRMSRRWTHNEQLFVLCCGIIMSRATFFGSEGVSGVKDFLKATFPLEFPGSMPSFIFFDKNCMLLQHLITQNDHYFDAVGLPVDVFHAKNKHHATDIFCQTHCNPAMFKELIGADNNWVFNSSAAEQANVWFGAFQSIVREMPVSKYNFYLDEMIAIRNRFTAGVLHRGGCKPHFRTEAFLRGEE